MEASQSLGLARLSDQQRGTTRELLSVFHDPLSIFGLMKVICNLLILIKGIQSA
jgi:hypothetical protein